MSQPPVTQNTPATPGLPAPDPARGLFETLLIVEGEPIELDAHLARLAASLGALYGIEPPAGLGNAVRERAAGTELGRLRVVVDPGPQTAAEIVVTDVDPADVFPGPDRGAILRSVHCPDGLGRHKWADRRPLAAVAAPSVPLLLDRGDELLEAGRANVFAARDGALFTPADDGRILPGLARAGAIAAAREVGIDVHEGPLTLTELLAADEVFLTGSVRGVEPAQSLDGTPLLSLGALATKVATGLRRRWRTGRPKGRPVSLVDYEAATRPSSFPSR
jgi:para-aminobenzoate synthetase/4-amino-4-deoxychorismate lyase